MACPPWRYHRPPRSLAGTRLMRRILPPVALSGAARVWSNPSPGLDLHHRARLSDPQTRPLAILLDGQFWGRGTHAGDGRRPLAALTREGLPAGGLPADRARSTTSAAGLSCPVTPRFLAGGAGGLLPLVHGYAPFSDRPDRTCGGPGQSFGGLAAMFAALSTGRSALAACSASRAPTGGRTGDGRGTGFIGEQLRQGEGVRGRAARLAGSGPTRTESFFARTRCYWRNSPHTADDFLASG